VAIATLDATRADSRPRRATLRRWAAPRLIRGRREVRQEPPNETGQPLDERLLTADSTAALRSMLVSAIAQTLRVPSTSVEVFSPDGARLDRPWTGAWREDSVEVPVVFGNSVVARIVVASRGRESSLSAQQLRLLRDVARRVAPAVYARHVSDELELTRGRLANLQQAERHRLQCLLHDGIGPPLVGLALQVGAARSQLAAGQVPAAEEVLRRVELELGECAELVRRLVVDMQPPTVANLGLIGALRHRAACLSAPGGPVITVTTHGTVRPLCRAVENVVLAIVSEAMTNAVRHARAHRCVVTIGFGAAITGVVRDDGRGITNAPRHGIGISSMIERAVELGGGCVVRPAVPTGTEVEFWLPSAVPEATLSAVVQLPQPQRVGA
jgi:signal transduction histidine kinase